MKEVIVNLISGRLGGKETTILLEEEVKGDDLLIQLHSAYLFIRIFNSTFNLLSEILYVSALLDWMEFEKSV